jgi:hypothetical protein
MKCECGKTLHWQGDHEWEQDGSGITITLSCENDDCAVDTVFVNKVTKPKDDNNED